MTAVLIIALAASGCVSISKYTPPPEDERPIVKVGATGAKEPKVKVEVELLERPDLSRFGAAKTPDNELYGNRGNLVAGVLSRRRDLQPQQPQQPQDEPRVWWPDTAGAGAEPQAQVKEPSPAYTIIKYKVKKGQTLGDISKQFYGTTKKWKKIYEANEGRLKDPDKIYAGQMLDIPSLEEGAARSGRLK